MHELDRLETTYEKLCIEAGMEVWEYYSDPGKNSMTNYKESFSGFLLNDSVIHNIKYWYSKSNELSNDTLIRRLALWNNVVLCGQVDFDPEIIELQNSLETQLSEYPSDAISDNELELSILRLINLRNSKAKKLGYGNYAYLVLQNTGIDTVWFENLILSIDSVCTEEYNVFIGEHFPNNSDVEYEDLKEYIIQSYLINDNPVIKDEEREKLIYETLSNIGIEVNDLPIHLEITELPPGIGGFGNCIDIPNDFRAVARKELSFYYLLHEIGHGLYWTNVKIKHPVLEGYEWCTGNSEDLYNESMAEVIAKFSQNKEWLKENGFDETSIDRIRNHRKEIYPVYLKLMLVNSLFEIELYKHPEKKPSTIKNELYRKFFNVDKDFSKKPNLIQLAYVSYPVYEQNYLIADIISWQVHEYMEKEYGENYAMNPEVGSYLVEKLWKDGEMYSWQSKVERATGKELDLKGYLKYLME
jgi:peptidyl-dipeptidase A